MTDIKYSDPEIARSGYEQYAYFTGGKTFDGRDMPQWDDLPQRIRNAWCATAHAIIQAHRQRPLLGNPLAELFADE